MDSIVDRVRLSSNPTDDTTMDNGMQLCLVALGSESLYIKCQKSHCINEFKTLKCFVISSDEHQITLLSHSRNGALKIDGNLEGELQAAGQTKSIEVQPTFFLGNLLSETLEIGVVRNNLQVISITLKNSTSKLYSTPRTLLYSMYFIFIQGCY